MTNDVNEMESILTRYRPAGPDATVRERVVGQAQRRWRGAFAEAMVAMLLVGMNLAQIGASVTQVISVPHIEEARTQQLAEAIACLDLPITQDETYAMARQFSAGERLTLLPLVHGNPSINANIGVIP